MPKLVYSPNPLVDLKAKDYPEGTTIAEMLEDVDLPASDATVLIGGGKVKRIYWEKQRPKGNAIVRATVVPRGGEGGKNILGIILGIAVIAAAVFAGPLLAGALGLTGGLAGLVGPAIGILGSLAIRALTGGAGSRPNAGSLTSGRESFARDEGPNGFLQAARNDFRINQVIPLMLGKRRVAPPYGSTPNSRSMGATNRISHLFVWAQNLCDVSDLQVGDTPLDDFEDVRVFTNNGFPNATNFIRGFPDQTTQEDVNIELTKEGGWIERTAPPQSDRLGFDIGFTQLLRRGDTKIEWATVSITAQYREVGTGGWQSLPEEVDTTFPAFWREGSEFIFRDRTTKQRVWGVEFDVPSLGEWEIRWQRNTLDDDQREGDDLDRFSTDSFITAIRGIRDQRVIRFSRPLCMSTVIIRGSGQLNGALDRFTGILQSRMLDYDPVTQTWRVQATSNNASILRFVLTHPDNPEALAQNELDIPSFEVFHEWCTARSFEFNQYLERDINFEELTQAILSAGQAFKELNNNGQYSIRLDIRVPWPSTTICSRNLTTLEWDKDFEERPHAIRAAFNDRNQDWNEEETVMYFPGFDAATATNIETINKLGITSRNHLRRLLAFDINRLIHRNIFYMVETDWEVLPLRRGDRVWLQHDIIESLGGSARITQINLNGNDWESFEVDAPFSLDLFTSFTAVVRVPTLSGADRHITTGIGNFDGDTSTIVLAVPIDITTLETVPARGDLVIYGVTGQEYRDCLVREIEVREEERARITMVEYKEDEVYNNVVVPPNDPPVSGNPLVLPAPVLVEPPVTDETVLEVSADRLSAQERVFIKVRRPSDEFANAVLNVQGAVSVRGDYDEVEVTSRTPTSLTIGGVQTDETWNFRIRWEAGGFLPSPWTFINGLQIVGRSTPPAPLSNVRIGNTGEQNVITWDEAPELDVQFGGMVCIRYSNDFNATFSETVEIARVPERDRQAFLAPVNGIYFLVVKDSFGKKSTAVSIETTQISVIPYEGDVLATEHPTFPGTKTGVVVDGVTLKLDNTGLWDDRTGLFDDDTTTLWDSAGGQETEGTYDFANFVTYAQVETFRLTMELESFEVANTSPLWDSVPGNWDDQVGMFDGDVGDNTEVEMWARLTDDDPTGSPTWGPWFRITSEVVNARAAQGRIVIKSVSDLYNRQVTFLRLVGNKV